MRYIKILIILITISVFAISCKSQKKEMTMEDFVKIDLEIASTNQKTEAKEKITKKYGYTLGQYSEFLKKVESDPKLIEKRGEILLKQQKSKKK